MSEPGTPPFDLDELRAQVEQLDGGIWRVEKTLRSTPYGETQLVYRNGSEAGPFIRKLIPSDVQQGNAYDLIFSAQASGKRFAHVPVIYDCTKTDSGISVVMEYVPGKTLRDYVANIGPGDRAARFASQALCDALVELHTTLSTPIIHRDIKPSNVMVSPAGVTFIDLDITRSWKAGAERDTLHFGTPGYAPPEQFGFEQTGVTGDIFAAGMTLAFCCTGEDPTAALRESGFDDPRIPLWIRPILVRATQFDPSARYQSAAEMRQAVQVAMAGGRPAPAPKPAPAPTANSGWQNPPTTPYAGAPAPQQAPQPTESTLVRTLKYMWNAIWAFCNLYVLFIVATALPELVTRYNWSEFAIWQIVLVVVSTVAIIVALLVVFYLGMFKLHLRKVKPFSRFTWRQELPAGVGYVTFVWIATNLMSYLAQH